MAKKGTNWFKVTVIMLCIAGTVGGLGYLGYYIYESNKTVPPVPPVPSLGDEITTVHNGETDRNVLIDIYVRNIYDPDYTVVAGIRIYIYQYGSSPSQLAANGMSPDEAILLDYFDTDSAGKGRSTRNFLGGTLLTAVVGLDTSTNKSQLKNFVVQGLTSSTVPTSVNCGIFYYKVMAEETDTTWTWTDNQGSAITTWNYTADSDGVLEAKIKLVLSTSGECLRDIWSRAYGTLQLHIGVKVTHANCTSSGAIDVESSHYDKATPGNQLVFVITLPEIVYEVDSTGSIEEAHESYRTFAVKLDFGGCGFVDSASTDTQLSIGGWCLLEQDYDQVLDAGLPSGDSTNWLKDVLGALTITT